MSDSELDSISVIKTSQNSGNILINNSTATFKLNAIDAKGNSVIVSPLWELYPKDAGTITTDGVFTPESSYIGRAHVVASVFDTIRAEYNDGTAPGILVGATVVEKADTLNDKLDFSLIFPDSSASLNQPVTTVLDYSNNDNNVYKTVPQKGVSLISAVYNISKTSSAKISSDTITSGDSSIVPVSKVFAHLKIPSKYNKFIDGTASKFTIAVWNDDSLFWDYTWKYNESSTRAASDSSLPPIFKSLNWNEKDKSFSIAIGDSLNNSKKNSITLGLVFNEADNVEGSVSISPNPFSPYVSPMRDYNYLPNMNADAKGTCIKVTPMSSSSGTTPKVTIDIYTANRTLVWQATLNNTIPGHSYFVFWDGKTRVNTGGDHFEVDDFTPITPQGKAMCRNGRYFAIIKIDDGKNIKRFTKEIVLFK